MTDGARIDRPAVALQLNELQAVFRLRAGRDGVRAVVTGFAIHAAVIFGETIQRLILVVLAAVVAGVTARLFQPRGRILRNGLHITVTGYTGLRVRRRQHRHDIAQAERLRTGMPNWTAVSNLLQPSTR